MGGTANRQMQKCLLDPNGPRLLFGVLCKPLKGMAGDDETRTRDLCRDSGAGSGFTTTYKDRGDCQSTRKSCKTSHFVGWVVGWEFPTTLAIVDYF
jgi:hypothetical protein